MTSLYSFLRGVLPAVRTNPDLTPDPLPAPRRYSRDELAAAGEETARLALRVMRPDRAREAADLATSLPTDRHEAWEACAARGLIPDAWVGEGRRQFMQPCPDCRGLGSVPARAPDDEVFCATCKGAAQVPLLVDAATPPDAASAAMLALHPNEVRTAEALARAIAEQLGMLDEPARWFCVEPALLTPVEDESGTLALRGHYLVHEALGVPMKAWSSEMDEAVNASYRAVLPLGRDPMRRGLGVIAKLSLLRALSLRGLNARYTRGLRPDLHEAMLRVWMLGFGITLRHPIDAPAFVLLIAPKAA